MIERLFLALEIASLLVCGRTVAATLRTVALSGRQAPGTDVGVEFSAFRDQILNNAGQVAFEATLVGSGVSEFDNNAGIWSEDSGALGLVVRKGGKAPGVPEGVKFNGFGATSGASYVLNDAGQTAFFASLTGGGVDGTLANNGIWSEGSGALASPGRGGDAAPGTPTGVLFWNLSQRPNFNNLGQTAFWAELDGPGFLRRDGLWKESPAGLTLVALEGNQVPGLPDGIVFGGFYAGEALNDAGQTAFFTALAGSGVDATNNAAVWSEGSGSVALVARAGDQAEGLPTGVTYRSFPANPVALNNVGQVAFRASLTGPGVDGTNNQAIWSGVPGSFDVIARAGDLAPGAGHTVRFRAFDNLVSQFVYNDAGQVAFNADLVGDGVAPSNDGGVWLGDSTGLALLAREGDRAPGTPNGVVFSFLSASSSAAPVLNDFGQAAFRASLTGTGVDSTNSAGVWATDRAGRLQLIVRTGDQLEVAPGDVRTVSALSFVGNAGIDNGRRRKGFNDLGQVAFGARFSDGSSGVFVSNAVALPEPSAIAILGTSLVLLVGPTRRGKLFALELFGRRCL